ncbi:MAG: hypothetical protein Q9207_002699 [Kuettlingeria erythrocarpa]
MVSKAGVALKSVSTFLRVLELLGSLLILGICSYWMGVLSHRNSSIPTWMKAVEGISGGAVIYTAFAVILTFFLGGKTFFAFLGLLLDILFCGAMIAIAVLTRHGTHSCPARDAPSPIGAGNRTSCRLETAVFAVAIILALHFLITAALEVLLKRVHAKEKRYGPGPSNNYTSGSGKKAPFWKRNRGPKTTHEAYGPGGFSTANGAGTTNKKQPFWKRNKKPVHDTELGAGGAGALIAEEKHRHDNGRTSHETGVTGTTAGSPGATYGGSTNKYSNEPTIPYSVHQNGVSGTTASNGYQPYSQGAYQGQPQNTHESTPYPNGGYPHIEAATSNHPTTFGHGNYNAS